MYDELDNLLVFVSASSSWQLQRSYLTKNRIKDNSYCRVQYPDSNLVSTPVFIEALKLTRSATSDALEFYVLNAVSSFCDATFVSH